MPPNDPIPELKRHAATELVRLLDGWNAHDAASAIGTDQPRISDLRRGKLDRFSLETLIRFLARWHHRVRLEIEDDRATMQIRSAVLKKKRRPGVRSAS